MFKNVDEFLICIPCVGIWSLVVGRVNCFFQCNPSSVSVVYVWCVHNPDSLISNPYASTAVWSPLIFLFVANER